MASVQYNDSRSDDSPNFAETMIAKRRIANRRPNYYRKPDREIVDEKTIRRNSSSGIDGRVLFGAKQAGNGGDAPTEGSAGNHRKQRIL